MIVERLDGPPYERIQCQLPKAELHDLGYKGYREKRATYSRSDPETCMRNARWRVDGLNLCTQHAGSRALDHLAGPAAGANQ
ncbi:hypothetical protein [Sphingomonas sp. CCH9-E2]|uniref:hypothetical protein n=1 Tax=Sphingomonas sp. CCH9-E2 TaxID=1768776 RepID=UPI000830A08C|nr:hypothetical protein [Sphingomonas sp. CCH9-E2]